MARPNNGAGIFPRPYPVIRGAPPPGSAASDVEAYTEWQCYQENWQKWLTDLAAEWQEGEADEDRRPRQ